MAGGLKNFDPSYKVPAVISGQFGTLRKELASVLKDCFNKNELAAIANSLGIDIPEGTSGKEISKWIINKVCLLSNYKNIIIKYGRYITNQEKHYDEVLGVYLASENQYAERIS